MPSDALDSLLALSEAIGRDPALVQAAGGNTSLKSGDVLWIKASGTWLMNARSQPIMVPVQLGPLLQAVKRQDPAADQPHDFTIGEENRAGLRPSIETTVHAVRPQRVVVHVHCVSTIAWACLRGRRAPARAEARRVRLGIHPLRQAGPAARACDPGPRSADHRRARAWQARARGRGGFGRGRGAAFDLRHPAPAPPRPTGAAGRRGRTSASGGRDRLSAASVSRVPRRRRSIRQASRSRPWAPSTRTT